jgi:predicted lipoprotein with Yx(FWY)xxD motif
MNVRTLFACTCAAVVFTLGGLAACAPAPTPIPPPPSPTTVPPPSPTAMPPTPAAAASTPASIPVTGASATATPGGPANALIRVARIQGFGLFLTDNVGITLYAFAKDTNDVSNCSGNCTQTWPPFTAQSAPQVDSPLNATLVTMVTRQDGTMQVSYDGHPLYYYSGDKIAGDVKGHGIGNVWHVLSPRGSPMTNPPPPTATSAP